MVLTSILQGFRRISYDCNKDFTGCYMILTRISPDFTRISQDFKRIALGFQKNFQGSHMILTKISQYFIGIAQDITRFHRISGNSISVSFWW